MLTKAFNKFADNISACYASRDGNHHKIMPYLLGASTGSAGMFALLTLGQSNSLYTAFIFATTIGLNASAYYKGAQINKAAAEEQNPPKP